MENENKRFAGVLDKLSRIKKGFDRSLDESRDDHRTAMKRYFDEKGIDDPSMADTMFGSNRTVTTVREMLGKLPPEHQQAINDMGMGLDKDPFVKAGQVAGTAFSDIVQDRGRSVWWLLNAPQAVVNVAQEQLLNRYAPDYRGTEPVMDSLGRPVNISWDNEKGQETAKKMGLIDDNNKPKAKYSVDKDFNVRQRKEKAVLSDLLSSTIGPAGIAINSGMGLLNPFGGQEGYAAVFESEDDPSVSSNPVGEIAAKYILGRTGNLLPWNEFKKVRPDVSKDEYMAYKAFKFDKEADLNILDGDFTLPTGVLKGTMDGIHGPELQFLGRSLPVTTTILPTVAAIAGTTIGARRGGVRGGRIGGYGSMAAGMVGGKILEELRRRGNQPEKEVNPGSPPVDNI